LPLLTRTFYFFLDKKNLKYVSLVTLVVQNSALILLMRYTRASVPANELYLASTAVLMSEIIKTLVCLVVVYNLLPSYGRSMSRLVTFLHRELIVNWKETVKLALPAILYLIQVSLSVCRSGLDHQQTNFFIEQPSICCSNQFRRCNFSSDVSTQDSNYSIF
jgi:hypothetical protein